MASRHKDGDKWVIQFMTLDKKRAKIRLGKCDERSAAGVQLHVERLIEARDLRQPIFSETVQWLTAINDKVPERLCKVGLCEPRSNAATAIDVDTLVENHIKRRENEVKPGTLAIFREAKDKLNRYIGGRRSVRSLTLADGLSFKEQMLRDYSKAYTAKMIYISRQIFKVAVQLKLLEANPFAGVKAPSQVNRARQKFVPAEIIQKVLDAETDPQRALVYALARFGGFRIPSELVKLRWADLDFSTGKMLVHSPKTEHHEDCATRYVPIFPELVPYFNAMRAVADEDEERVVPRFGWKSKNLRTQLFKTLERLNIEPWPKLFQNLRSSRETELAKQFPLHLVCAWIGNSPDVARDHYLQILDEDFLAAAGLTTKTDTEKTGAKSGAAHVGKPPQRAAPYFGKPSVTDLIAGTNDNVQVDAKQCEKPGMGAVGFEPTKA